MEMLYCHSFSALEYVMMKVIEKPGATVTEWDTSFFGLLNLRLP
jgi:hypothetical protein